MHLKRSCIHSSFNVLEWFSIDLHDTRIVLEKPFAWAIFPEYDQDVTRRIFRVEELENVSTLISDSITRFHR